MIYFVIILSAVQLALIFVLIYQLRLQFKHLQLMMDYQRVILAHMQFCNDANEMMLWKDRCDIINWKEKLIKTENYEALQETVKATNHIANMIETYRKTFKKNEN